MEIVPVVFAVVPSAIADVGSRVRSRQKVKNILAILLFMLHSYLSFPKKLSFWGLMSMAEAGAFAPALPQLHPFIW
jgi:hypothetical protein